MENTPLHMLVTCLALNIARHFVLVSTFDMIIVHKINLRFLFAILNESCVILVTYCYNVDRRQWTLYNALLLFLCSYSDFTYFLLLWEFMLVSCDIVHYKCNSLHVVSIMIILFGPLVGTRSVKEH